MNSVICKAQINGIEFGMLMVFGFLKHTSNAISLQGFVSIDCD